MPILRNKNIEELRSIFKNAYDDNKFNPDKFQFYIKNNSALNRDNHYTSTLITKKLTHHSHTVNDKRSLLTLIIENDKTLTSEKRNSLLLKINNITELVPDINDTSLLEIYDQFGESGIQKILDLINRDVILFNQLELFQNETFTLCYLVYQDAIQAISDSSINAHGGSGVYSIVIQQADNLIH